ncbi:MAG: hypothetical protein IJH79_04680, partial [Lentisphaeria bacterium]|nr:hypothetical protein [Lentisphaeria bacterium]
MKERIFVMTGKIALIAAAAILFGAMPCSAAPKGSAAIQQRIRGTVKSRVELLTKLVADYEKQF